MSVPVAASTATAPAQVGHPNRADVTAGTRSVNHLPAAPGAIAGPRPAEGQLRVPKVPMEPALVGLDPVAGAHFQASDGVLELSAPAGAVTAADGKLSLLVRQVEPGSGSNA
ncbi:MAG TPA: hypothetical protein VOB72_18290, partial [Candidatus Dormibacteraeota bacterium]|nr:hypothetical protein [Candidatus Dormibacteraeota bacterium]